MRKEIWQMPGPSESFIIFKTRLLCIMLRDVILRLACQFLARFHAAAEDGHGGSKKKYHDKKDPRRTARSVDQNVSLLQWVSRSDYSNKQKQKKENRRCRVNVRELQSNSIDRRQPEQKAMADSGPSVDAERCIQRLAKLHAHFVKHKYVPFRFVMVTITIQRALAYRADLCSSRKKAPSVVLLYVSASLYSRSRFL